MEQSAIKKIYELIGNIPVTIENAELIEEIKIDLQKEDYTSALQKIEMLGPKKENDLEYEDEEDTQEQIASMYPKELRNRELERQYIGLLLEDPRYIIKYF